MEDNIDFAFPLITVKDNSEVLRQFLLRVLELTGINSEINIPFELTPVVKIMENVELKEVLSAIQKELNTQNKRISRLEQQIGVQNASISVG